MSIKEKNLEPRIKDMTLDITHSCFLTLPRVSLINFFKVHITQGPYYILGVSH